MELGVTRAAIEHALACGRLRAIHRGVYAVGHLALPPLARELAALLAVGDGAVLSHGSAAAVFGLAPAIPERAEVTVTLCGRDAGRRRPGLRVHRVRTLDPRDVWVRAGIALTSPARTVVDQAWGLSDRELERCLDEAIVRRLATRPGLLAAIDRVAHRRGVERLRALAADREITTVTRSEAEERFLVLVRRARLPTPEVNVPLGRFTVDFRWPAQGLVVEVDGYAFHSGRRSFELDHERDLELRAGGHDVLRFTWRQIVAEPEFVLARLTWRLATPGPHLGRLTRIVS